MHVTFKNTHKLSEGDLFQIKNKFGTQFPEELLLFFKEYAGSRPVVNDKLPIFETILPGGSKTSSFIEEIITLELLLKPFDVVEDLKKFAEHFELPKEYVDVENLVPFAMAATGALFHSIGGIHKGKVYFVDNGDFGILFQSETFKDFWASVYPYTDARKPV